MHGALHGCFASWVTGPCVYAHAPHDDDDGDDDGDDEYDEDDDVACKIAISVALACFAFHKMVNYRC